MAEPNNKEEYILNSDWEELIDQTDITPLVMMTDENTPEYTVTINQPEGATITVALLSGETKTETFTAKQGTVYTVSISGDNASKLILNTNGGKVLGDMTIEARDYSKDDNPNYCSIIILQEHAEDQVIYCHLTNPDGTEDTTEYRNSLWVQPGSRCDFTLETNFVRKWDLGKLNVETINPVTKNVNYVYATPPVIRDDFDPTICVVTIIQVPHMTIHVWVTAPGETTEVEHTESFNAKIGSTYRITTTMESDWYEGGRVLYPTTGTFSLDCTITGVSPELVMFTVHIIQTAHQTITVNCNGANYTTDFTARKNSIWKATITPETNYRAGTITPQENGTLVADITITATEAKLAVLTLNMVPPWEGVTDLYKSFTAINSIVSVQAQYGNIDGSDEGGHSGRPGNAMWIQCTDSGKYWFESNVTNDGERTCWVRVTPGKTYNLHAYGRRYKGRGYGFVLRQNDTVESQANRVWLEDL